MTREQIKATGMNIYFESVSKNGDDWLVVGDGKIYILLRNQGEHDRSFFIVGKFLTSEEAAIAKAQWFCNR